MKKYFYFICSFLLFISCSSDNEDNPSKDLKQEPVNFKINMNYQDKELQSVGVISSFRQPRLSGEYVGKVGLYVYHSKFGLKCYDISCPYEWSFYGILPNKEDNTVKCSYCKSVYSLETGKSLSGPAKEKGFALVEYLVTDKGDNIYNISNPNYKK